VSTSTGAEGLDLRPGVDLEIADEPEGFARTCVRLLNDPAARERLGTCGRRRVLERYRWDRIGELAERALTPAPDALPANGWAWAKGPSRTPAESAGTIIPDQAPV
jgi:glycosyl transferase family 1